MTKFYVYALIDPRDNQPFYIGKGCGKRAQSHLRETKEKTQNIRKFYKIQSIREDGYEPSISYLFENLEESEAYEKEESEIKRLGRKDLDPNGTLMNLVTDSRPPNRQGKPHKDSTKAKMSKASLGRKKSPEHCKSIGISKKGENHPYWGKTRDPETIEKIRESNLGQKRSAEARKNIAKAHAVTYEVTSPEGKSRVVDSVDLKKLCEAYGLNKGSFVNACREGRPYKGWTISRL